MNSDRLARKFALVIGAFKEIGAETLPREGTKVLAADVLECSLEDRDLLVSINQTGIPLGVPSVVPGMVEAGGVRRSTSPPPGAHGGGTPNGIIAYVTTKAAVLRLTRDAAMNLARHGVCVNSISPAREDRPGRNGRGKRARIRARRAALEPIPGRMALNSEISPDRSPTRVGQAQLHHGRRFSGRRWPQSDSRSNLRSRAKKSSFIKEPDATQ
jgi:NAD(P)-dependent dehydrogenase (short-subunit alcohol dehydrogenase family)